MSDTIGSAFLASRVGAVPITITTGLDPEGIEAAAKLELGLEGQVAVTVYGAPRAPRPRRPTAACSLVDHRSPTHLHPPTAHFGAFQTLIRLFFICFYADPIPPAGPRADLAANELLVLDVGDRTGAATLLEEAVVKRCPFAESFARAAWSSVDGLDASEPLLLTIRIRMSEPAARPSPTSSLLPNKTTSSGPPTKNGSHPMHSLSMFDLRPRRHNEGVCDGVGDGSTAPVWKHASECYQCKATFTWGYGLYAAVNRHHCRSCGASACDEHSTHVLQLPQFGHADPQRVCDECWGTAPPESKGVNSTEEEISFVKTVVAESGGHLDAAELAEDAMAKEHKLLTALAARLDGRVHTTRRSLDQAQQTLPRVRKLLEEAEALAKSDSPGDVTAPEVDHSVINFSYSSPQLTKLGGLLPPIRAALVAAEEQLATRGTEFTAAVDAAKVVAGAITAAVQDMMKAGAADWGVAFGHKIAGLKAAAEGLGRVSAASYDDETTRYAVCDAHDVVIKARRELRAMVVQVVKHTIVAADATRGCGVEYLAFGETLGPVDAAARELTQVLAGMEHSLHQWHRRRKAIVSAGHRKDQIWQGNLHHKLNQKIKLLETENGALRTKLANDETSLAPAPTSVRAAPSDHQSAVDKTVAQLRTERETLLKTIGELSARLDARQHDQVQENEEARARAAGQRVGFLEMSQRCDALRLENQVLGEKLGAEQRLNQRRLRELQGTAQDIAASNQSLSDERDALRAHMEQMAEHQGVIQQNAEAMRKRGFSSEEALIRYHEALVHVYRTVHPTGGNGDGDENRLALREDSELPDDVARLVDDFTAANALVVGKLEQLEEELATRPDGDGDGGGGGDHFVDAQSGPGDAAAMAHVAINMPDVPKWGAEVIRLRAMGFDAPHARLVAMLDQTRGNMQEAANRLLEIA